MKKTKQQLLAAAKKLSLPKINQGLTLRKYTLRDEKGGIVYYSDFGYMYC